MLCLFNPHFSILMFDVMVVGGADRGVVALWLLLAVIACCRSLAGWCARAAQPSGRTVAGGSRELAPDRRALPQEAAAPAGAAGGAVLGPS